MKTMTIGKKISFACIALVALTIILGSVSIFEISGITAHVQGIVDGPLPGIHSIGAISGHMKEQKVAMMEHMGLEDIAQMTVLESRMADLEGKLQAELKSYEKTIQTANGRVLFAKVGPVHERFNRIWAKILPLSRGNKAKEALEIWRSEAVPQGVERAKLIDEIAELRRATGVESGESAISAGKSGQFWSALILVISVVSGGLLAFFIVRGINKVLTHAVTELGEGAEQVASASGQVSGSSQSLAQGASEQAASLEETSASSAEMSSMTRKNSENSQQAAVLMNAVSQRVVEANRTLADMVTSMEEISASSGKISKIIKVIDEIAFQTNILALNAAVEAARAGEAGMGFAVVADEVRNLAQRSAQAAKDTASLIEESILKSAEGGRKLGEVASSIQAITEGAGKVKMLVDEVEASSKEQAQGIEQISKAVAQMDQVTQGTAASAEESASASEQLNAQSLALMAVVEQLQALVGGHSGHTSLVRKAATATRSVPTNRKLHSTGPARKPALAAVSAGKPGDFPLDDSEFKEF